MASLVGAVGWGRAVVIEGVPDGVLPGGSVGQAAGAFVGVSGEAPGGPFDVAFVARPSVGVLGEPLVGSFVGPFAATGRVGVPGESPADSFAAVFVARPS